MLQSTFTLTNSIAELTFKLNEDLSAIHNWSELNGLLLNPAKSQVIRISNQTFNTNLVPDLWLSDQKFKHVESLTSLGCVINRNLSGYSHTNFVIGRIYSCLRKLWLTASFTQIETRRKLVRTLVVPIITYAEVVYSDLDSVA